DGRQGREAGPHDRPAWMPRRRARQRRQPDRAAFDAGCMSPRAVRALLRTALVALCLALAACRGTLVHEVQSPYSHIQVYDTGGRRALYFGGEERGRVVETLMDLREPHVLQHGYIRAAM